MFIKMYFSSLKSSENTVYMSSMWPQWESNRPRQCWHNVPLADRAHTCRCSVIISTVLVWGRWWQMGVTGQSQRSRQKTPVWVFRGFQVPAWNLQDEPKAPTLSEYTQKKLIYTFDFFQHRCFSFRTFCYGCWFLDMWDVVSLSTALPQQLQMNPLWSPSAWTTPLSPPVHRPRWKTFTLVAACASSLHHWIWYLS